jgi:hypothetical protein
MGYSCCVSGCVVYYMATVCFFLPTDVQVMGVGLG